MNFHLRVIVQGDIPLALRVNVAAQHRCLEVVVSVQALLRKVLRVYQTIVLRIGSAITSCKLTLRDSMITLHSFGYSLVFGDFRTSPAILGDVGQYQPVAADAVRHAASLLHVRRAMRIEAGDAELGNAFPWKMDCFHCSALINLNAYQSYRRLSAR